MTPLQSAEKAVTDVHFKLSALAERREKLGTQLAAAEAEERRLLKSGTDLKALAGVRAQIVAGRDLIASAAAETEALEARLDELDETVRREAAQADLGTLADRGTEVEKRLLGRLDRIAKLLGDELTGLSADHAELLKVRSAYDQAGAPLSVYWSYPGEYPTARRAVEALLRRRGHSLRAVDPGGLKQPASVSPALQAAWQVYGVVKTAAWIAAGLEAEQRKRDALAERRERQTLPY